MSARVDSGFRRVRTRPGAQKIIRGTHIKPQPLIYEPQHKNINTLISFLVTLLVGLSAGWLVGSIFFW
jgi:hypothetical protein